MSGACPRRNVIPKAMFRVGALEAQGRVQEKGRNSLPGMLAGQRGEPWKTVIPKRGGDKVTTR